MSEAVRIGLRTRLAQLGQRWLGPLGIIGGLCAMAVTPLLTGGQTYAELLGSLGANLLSDKLTRVLDRMPLGGAPPSLADIEREIVPALESGPDAVALRDEIDRVLHEVGAIEAFLSAAIAAGNREIIGRLKGSLEEFAGFRALTADVLDGLARIEAGNHALGAVVRDVMGVVLAIRADQLRLPEPHLGGAAAPRRWESAPYLGLQRFGGSRFGMYPAVEIDLHLDHVCAAQRGGPAALEAAFRTLAVWYQPAPPSTHPGKGRPADWDLLSLVRDDAPLGGPASWPSARRSTPAATGTGHRH